MFCAVIRLFVCFSCGGLCIPHANFEFEFVILTNFHRRPVHTFCPKTCWSATVLAQALILSRLITCELICASKGKRTAFIIFIMMSSGLPTVGHRGVGFQFGRTASTRVSSTPPPHNPIHIRRLRWLRAPLW